jgi:pyroglutamyl-peptidase
MTALRVLLTGFEPFGGERVNPSERLVRALARAAPPDPRLRLAAVVLPVDRRAMPPALGRALRERRPDVVIGVGQATGRAGVDLESVAHNRIDFRGERDNGGHAALGEPLLEGGPPRLVSRLPLRELAAALRARGLPVRVSRDAGRHLCNALLFELLARHPRLPSAFVHVPLLPSQAARRARGEPSLAEAVSRACLLALLRSLPEHVGRAPAPRRAPRRGAA